MTSSISNSRKKIKIAILISILMVGIFEMAARSLVKQNRRFKPLTKVSDEMPDLILVGNSMLGMNIDSSLLKKELSRLVGRKIRVELYGHSHTTFPYWYVLSKKYLKRAETEGIPIGFVGAGTSQFAGLRPDPKEIDTIWRELDFYDPILEQKLNLNFLNARILFRDLCYLCSRQSITSPAALKYFLRQTYDRWQEEEGHRSRPTLKRRFARFDYREERLERFLDESADVEIPSMNARVTASLIPDIRREFPNSPLFFVMSRPNFGKGKIKTLKFPEYSKTIHQFKDELKPYSISVVDMSLHKELGASQEYYGDGFHLTEVGKIVNTRILAEEIVRQKLLRPILTADVE